MRKLALAEQTKNISEWAKEFNVSAQVIYGRINAGWSIKDSITVPVGGKR